jgi:cysteine desulfurase
MDERVVDAMLPVFRDNFANPSSAHALGSSAAETVRVARGQVRSLIGAASNNEIVFTSGGSESNNTAILSAIETQAGRNEIVISSVEHPSMLAVCAYLERSGRARVHRIPVDCGGNLDINKFQTALSERTALVSCQWANNETGVILPVEMLAAMSCFTGSGCCEPTSFRSSRGRTCRFWAGAETANRKIATKMRTGMLASTIP